MSDLAQQCEYIAKQLIRGWPSEYHFAHPTVVDDVNKLLAYISELEAELASHRQSAIQAQRTTLALEAEIADLRRPVVQTHDLQGVFQWLEACANGDPIESRREAFAHTYEALDSAQREKTMVGEALRWAIANRCGNAAGMFGREINLHPEPPENLRQILLHYAGSKQT